MNDELYGIIQAAKSGSEQDKLAVIEQFMPLIKKYAYKLAYEDAKEDLILFFLELIPKIPNSLENDRQITAYIAKSVYLHYIKLSKKSCAIDAMEIHAEEILEAIPEATSIAQEDNVILKLLQTELTQHMREVLYLHYFAGYSGSEIAEYFHISRQAVNKTKKAALRRLKEQFLS